MTTASPHAHGVHYGRTDVQNVGMGVGIVLIVVGILGFIPGITTNYSELRFFGPDSKALFLGLFQVSMLLNIVQLAIGATGLTMSRTAMGARNFLMGSGLLYIVLSIYGFIVGVDNARLGRVVLPNFPLHFTNAKLTRRWEFPVLGKDT